MSQYGFRRGHSTYMALLDLYNKVSLACDKSKFSLVIFIDLAKAFDTLDPTILLVQLSNYGVRGIALDFFAI